MDRRLLIAGNWKMNTTYDQAVKLAGAIAKKHSAEADKLLKQLHGPRKGGVGRLEPIECEVLTRDGDRKHVRLTAAVQEEDGDADGVVFILSDMTEAIRLPPILKGDTTRFRYVRIVLTGRRLPGIMVTSMP